MKRTSAKSVPSILFSSDDPMRLTACSTSGAAGSATAGESPAAGMKGFLPVSGTDTRTMAVATFLLARVLRKRTGVHRLATVSSRRIQQLRRPDGGMSRNADLSGNPKGLAFLDGGPSLKDRGLSSKDATLSDNAKALAFLYRGRSLKDRGASPKDGRPSEA
jgi:hypothetical protein